MLNPCQLFFSEQMERNLSQSFLHLPTETSATGSPTTTTRDWARVSAVLSNLALDRNLNERGEMEDKEVKLTHPKSRVFI